MASRQLRAISFWLIVLPSSGREVAPFVLSVESCSSIFQARGTATDGGRESFAFGSFQAGVGGFGVFDGFRGFKRPLFQAVRVLANASFQVVGGGFHQFYISGG